MKSIEYYIDNLKDTYTGIFNRREKLFKSIMEEVDLKKISNVVIYATGSSSNAAFSARAFLSEILSIPVYIEEPSLSSNYMMFPSKETLYFAISQGGHSFSTIDVVERIQKSNTKIFTLTSDLNSPIAKISNNIIDMGMSIEEMPYVSAGYHATILDLILIGLELSLRNRKISQNIYEKYIEQLEKLISEVDTVIKKSKGWYDDQKSILEQSKRMIFIGYGSTYGVAREGETKVTETVRITSFGKELEEYMHGPYLGLHSDDTIIFIDPDGRLKKREEKLRQFLGLHVSNIFTISIDQTSDKEVTNNLNLNLRTNELFASLVLTIPIHLLSYYLSQEKGNNLEVSAFPEFDKITKSKI